MRMQLPDWRAVPVPTILWLNTGMLALSSIALHGARNAARRGEVKRPEMGPRRSGGCRFGLSVRPIGCLAAADGRRIPAGGQSGECVLLCPDRLARPSSPGRARGPRQNHREGVAYAPTPTRLRLPVDLCATYWHFLLLVWLVFLSILTGWAGEFVDICRQILT